MKTFRASCVVLPLLLLAANSLAAEKPAKPAPSTPATERHAGEATAERSPQRASTAASDQVVDINSATQAELEAHPLIGAAAAKAIVAARPFSSLDDLNRLQGISAERIEQIRLVVRAPALAAESPAPDRAGPEHNKIDVNTADRATLEALPSVGPDLAGAIIKARPFSRIDDLDRIQGISAERLEQLRTELMVATPAQPASKAVGPKKSKTAAPARDPELTPTGRAAPESRR